MKNLNKNTLSLVGFITLINLFTASVYSQDAQLSQFHAAPMMFNPAKTGVLKYTDMRISGVYRTQWSSISTSINTFQLSYDKEVGERFGIGGVLINTNSSAILNNTSFLFSSAYKIADPSQKNYQLSVGAQIGIVYKTIQLDELVYDAQFDGFVFDPELPTREAPINRDRLMFDSNIGVSFVSTDRSKKINPYADLAVFHLNMPKESFLDEEESRLPIRWVTVLGARVEMSRKFYIDPSVLLMKQRSSEQILASLIGTYELQGTPYHLMGGFGYRSQDAAIIYLGVRHNSNIFRLSYDINTSDLSQYTQNMGALEFSVIYRPGRRTSRVIY